MDADYSKEIYNNYYNIKDKVVMITLRDDTVLEGKLIGFFMVTRNLENSLLKNGTLLMKKNCRLIKTDKVFHLKEKRILIE
jgi:hypothetical protein